MRTHSVPKGTFGGALTLRTGTMGRKMEGGHKPAKHPRQTSRYLGRANTFARVPTALIRWEPPKKR
jgi:hypothetical protein